MLVRRRPPRSLFNAGRERQRTARPLRRDALGGIRTRRLARLARTDALLASEYSRWLD